MTTYPDSPKPPSSLSKNPWGMVVASAAMMAVSSTIWYAASVFFVALVGEFGWSYASTTSIFSIFAFLYGVWGILVGHLVDRFGARCVVLGGGLLFAIALTASGSAHALWHFYITHSILSSLGFASTSYVPVSIVLTRRFREHRGLALGIASAGAGIGILIFIPLTQLIINHWGWRVAFRALAAITALVCLPVGFFGMRETRVAPPEEDGPDRTPSLPVPAVHIRPESTLASAVRYREFWFVLATFVLLNGPIQVALTHHAPLLVEAGHTRTLVALIIGLVGLFSIGGKIGWGSLSDHWWLELIYVGGAGCFIGALLILLTIHPTSSIWSLYGYAVLMGLGYSMYPAITPVLCGRFFAGRHFGVILATLNCSYHSWGALASWLAGYAHDLTGSYRLPLVGCMLSAVLAVGCAWLAAPRRIPLASRH